MFTSEKMVKFLRENDCDYIQGYYYSKPCPIDDFMDKFIDKE